MAMKTHVVGFRPPDEKWKRMKGAWESCVEANVDIPDEVEQFFGGDPPDPRGIRVELEDKVCVSDYGGDMESGYEVELDKLPDNITHIRFWNSW